MQILWGKITHEISSSVQDGYVVSGAGKQKTSLEGIANGKIRVELAEREVPEIFP